METILVSGSYVVDPNLPMRRPMEFDRGTLVDMVKDDTAKTFVATVTVERYTPRLWWKHDLDVEIIDPTYEITPDNPLVTFVYEDKDGFLYDTPRLKIGEPGNAVISHVVSSLKSFDYHGS